MEHETVPLKEEKQFIREIKQLTHLREQITANMGRQDEVQQALDQRDQIEERLKVCFSCPRLMYYLLQLYLLHFRFHVFFHCAASEKRGECTQKQCFKS